MDCHSAFKFERRMTSRHELYFFRFGMIFRGFSQLMSRAKQLLRRQSFRRVTEQTEWPRSPLVLVAPPPPTTGSGEHLKPP